MLRGQSDSRFDAVAAALVEEINAGGELGCAIDIDGELVVDIWGGVRR